MVILFNEDVVRVRRLRVVGSAKADQPWLQLEVTRGFGSVHFHPSLPPEAILCVRRFEDPLPGRFRTDGTAPPRDWCEAVSKSLGTLFAQAARPAREAVGANTNAVRFADPAELLACLARDGCRSEVPGRWWWQLLFPTINLANAAEQAWIDSPHHAPAALRRLQEAHCACEFLSALQPPIVSRLFESVLTTFALTALRPTSAVKLTSTQPRTNDTRSAQSCAPAPWSHWVKDEPSLPLVPRQLLAVALMIECAPGPLRSAAFLRAWRAWQHYFNEEATTNIPVTPAPPIVSPSGNSIAKRPAPELSGERMSRVPARFSTECLNAADSKATCEREFTEQRGVHLAQLTFTRTGQVDHIRSPPAALHSQEANDHMPPETIPKSPPAAVSPCCNGRTPISSRPFRPIALIEPRRDIVQTSWGGVFYLLNVALAFGWYGDFTQPRRAGLALPVWDFLALLGLRMAGSESLDDPLWLLLARLSGRREDESPGSWFEPPVEWRASREWLSGFAPGGVWSWDHAWGRLRLRHPLGFLVLDVPLRREAPGIQLEDELSHLSVQVNPVLREDKPAMLPPNVNPLDRWLAWLVPTVEARLMSALGSRDLVIMRARVLRHQATIHASAAQIDVRFRLAEHPLELRLAGLDRDPGWVPAAGRSLHFHYD